MEDGEGQGHIQDDTDKTRSNAHVESVDTVEAVDVSGTVHESLELVRIDTLHLSLDDIDWVVGHGGAESSKSTRKKVTESLPGDVLAEDLLGIRENDEADTLVR